MPSAPDGAADLAARLVAQGPGKRPGQPTVIENRRGAARGRLAGAGSQAGALPPGEYAAFIRSELARREPPLRASGATVE